MKKIKRNIYYSIGVFFLIFAFPLVPGLSSAKFIILIVLLLFLLHKDFKKQLTNTLKVLGKKFLYCYLILFIITLALPILWQSFEWIMVGRIVSAFLLYFVSYIYFIRARNYIDIEKTIFYCFLIQSILIILAIGNQSFYDFTSHLRNISDEHQAAYGRLRGNAVSGYQFFGIVVMYAFVIVYYFLHTDKFKTNWLNIIIVITAAICSGRSVIIGIAVAIVFYLIKEALKGNVRKVSIIIIATIGISIGLTTLLINNYRKISDPVMVLVVERYFVKPIESITTDSGFESSSTDSLGEMYESDEIKKYFTWGSGRFQNEDGSYFGHVDIGYYRILGYYGYIGGFFALLLTIFLIFCSKSKLDTLSKIAFLTIIILYNFKGELAVWCNNIIPIIVAYLFFTNQNIPNNTLTKQPNNVKKIILSR